MQFQPILLVIIIFTLIACDRPEETTLSKLSIGVVSYGENEKSLQQYQAFQEYLGTQQNSLIELEPTYNEVKALEQIASKKWDLVFAPPGLAAIAIAQYNYEPLVPLEGRDQTRSVIVTQQDSTAKSRQDLAGETIALGQKGSATGYYLPIFNLYGLKFKQVLFAPTPKNILQLLDQDQIAAGALSLEDFNQLKRDYKPNQFKIMYLDRHNVPPGAILISDRLERNQQEQIRLILRQTPSFISSSAGYLPNEELPDYAYLTKVIKRVQEVLATSPMVLQ
ncbi:MAG: phosphate/phosphite/phosphonate ABC transporter substrate-binding protein [Pleurocapsa sp. SU_5_0]|nr:phosphate/phosphite/phosphonate ABC transporter substrate-binding protein [Pleurocapsa sp. SU_5_0]NJO95510.1 phosphate/phosphite/phosphonate ABC transporter substrate-binding protein [Pleurocapsa sp. CRU_1_2]NJR45644.1 phosphate/phosphite/phosphonate ABC transporter substrate-binding protein [Hyellaceae cyanobacterium CSU_1_1]